MINKTQNSFSSGIISTELLGRIDFEKIKSGLRQCENFIVRPVGGVQFAEGTTYVTDAIEVSRLIPFIESKAATFCLEFSDRLIRVINETGEVARVETTFLESEIDLIKYAQYKNQLFLVHENHCPSVLEHTESGWSLRNLRFNGSFVDNSMITSITLTSGTHLFPDKRVNYDKWQYAVSVVDADNNESLAKLSALHTNDISLSQQSITVSCNLSSTEGIDSLNFYKINGGEFFFVQKIAVERNRLEYSFIDGGLATDGTKSIKQEFTDFDTEYPKCVAFFNQRLIYGATKSKPNDIWGSNVGKYEDFTNTINLSSSEAFNLTLASGTLDEIESMIPLSSLIVFSSGKIWRIDGTSASNMSAAIESYSSISDLSPNATKKSILYIDASLNTISNFVYSYELNGYVGQNLDILARELFDGYRFVSQSFRNNPFPVFFCVREDGVMLALTYLREENIYAWSEMTTKGEYKDVCCLISQVNDKIFCKVKRKNGFFIEMFANQISANEDVKDSCHLHSSKIVRNNISDTVTGLDWLKGETVYVLADNNVYENIVVSEDGEITVDGISAYERIVVGLPYKGLIETISMEVLDQSGGSSIGIARKLCNATIMYYKTRGLKWGTKEDDLVEIKPYDRVSFGDDIKLESGKVNLPVSSNWGLDTSFFVAQEYPLPCFLQNITLGIEYGSKN